MSDLAEINEEVKNALRIIPVESVKQVLNLALVRPASQKKVNVIHGNVENKSQMSIKI